MTMKWGRFPTCRAEWQVGNLPYVMLGVALVLLLAGLLLAEADDKKPDAGLYAAHPERRHRARDGSTDKALDWLESKQIKQGENAGAWNTNQAFNALSMLAFMSSGHTPGRGKYGDVIEDGVLRPGVLSRVAKSTCCRRAQPTGYISSRAMYEHGLATLCLAEMYGWTPTPTWKRSCIKRWT